MMTDRHPPEVYAASGKALGEILDEALARVEKGHVPTPRKPPNPIAAYRFRNKVRFIMDDILRTYGSSRSKTFLIGAFGMRWRAALNSTYGDDPRTVAVSLIAEVLPCALEKSLSDDQRKLALYAIREDVRSEPVANHILNVFAAAEQYCPDNRVEVMNIIYHAVAALEGYRGADRVEHVRQRFIEHLKDAGT